MVAAVQVVGVLASLSLLAGTATPWEALPSAAPAAVVVAPAPAPASPLAALLPAETASAIEGQPAGQKQTAAKKRQAQSTQPASTPPDCAKLKCIALTMDDGPVANTARVLDLLRREQVHATFFVTGVNASARPGIIRRMVADGNAVGNHSWNHPQFWHISKAAVRRQLARTDAVLKRITGKRPTIVRTPFGEFDARVRAVAKSRGQALIQWSVDPVDWRDHNSRLVTKRVLKNARRDAIILSHDVWPTTRRAYAGIIRGLKAKGYTLVTVPELLAGRAKPGVVYFRG